MKETNHRSDLQELRLANSQQRWAILGLILIVGLLVFKVMGKEHTVVLEPPSRAMAIGMTGDRVDANWLTDMGLFIAESMLDLTPQSYPSLHGDLQQRMTVQAKRLVEANATTSFWPNQVAPDVDNQRVVLLGQLDTMVNGMRTSRQTVAYRADFQAKNGRVLLKAWEEVPADDPWLVKAMQLAERAERDAKGKTK
jgi:type IV conjugative transfer system protein TraE